MKIKRKYILYYILYFIIFISKIKTNVFKTWTPRTHLIFIWIPDISYSLAWIRILFLSDYDQWRIINELCQGGGVIPIDILETRSTPHKGTAIADRTSKMIIEMAYRW